MTSKKSTGFRWLDRKGAVAWASYQFRLARDTYESPILLSEACGRAIGGGDSEAAGRFSTSAAIDDTRWTRFQANVEEDILWFDAKAKYLKG